MGRLRAGLSPLFGVAASLLLLAATSASAQVLGTQYLTATSSDCSTAGSCASYTAIPAGTGALSFTVSGIGSNTVTFEVTADGQNWVATVATSTATGTAATTTTANGTFVIYGGFLGYRARASVFSSGLVVITAAKNTGYQAGGSFLTPLYAPDGSAGTPSYAWSSIPTFGWYLYDAANFTLALAQTGAPRLAIGNGNSTGTLVGVTLNNTGSFNWNSSTQLQAGTVDVSLFRDAANTLALRNGAAPTNAQTFRIYNTLTDASNYERGALTWSSNFLRLQTEKAGTGTARSLVLSSQAQLFFNTDTTDTTRWLMNTSGHFLAATDNVNDIGAASANRPRNLYLGTAVAQIGTITTTGTGVPLIVAQGRSTAQTAAVASVTTYTPTADASFLVSANVLVTTATSHSFTVTVAFTDEGNTARTYTMSWNGAGGGTPGTSIVNANGAVPYPFIPLHIRAKANTAITIATAGTFTTVTYNVEATIQRIS